MQHLAIIPDGNRRWAAQNKLESVFGHRKGMQTVKDAISVCLRRGIKYLSFYTFSLENFRRSELEKRYLFNLLADGFTQELPELIKHGIKVCFIGDRGKFPDKLKEAIEKSEKATKDCDALQLNLLFCYGARAEIVYAVKDLAQKIKDGNLSPDMITEDTVSNALWTTGIPDPDLIIRTGGVVRLSNYMLFQAAYSEFKFVDYFWPDMNQARLDECLDGFFSVKRNFGK